MLLACNFYCVFSVGIGGKSYGSRKADDYGSGMKTLRLRSKGTATVEVVIWHAYILAAVHLCCKLVNIMADLHTYLDLLHPVPHGTSGDKMS